MPDYDYTVLYQPKPSGGYLVSVPALGWSVVAPTREAAHREMQENIPARFTDVQQGGKTVEEDSEVLSLSGTAPDQLTVTVPKRRSFGSNPGNVTATEMNSFQFCPESWRRKAQQKQWAAVRPPTAGGGQRREDDPFREGEEAHEAWQEKRWWLSGIMTWAGRGAVGAVGLGALGLALDQFDVPVPRGLLLDVNLVVEGAGALLVCALVVLVETWCWWYRAGFGLGWTLSADDITLRSSALGLSGKPDRMVLRRGWIIPEEKKGKPTLYEDYILQLGVYLVLIEERFARRPPYGFVVLGNGQRKMIDNTEALRDKVRATAEEIRAARTRPWQTLEGPANTNQCGGCIVSKGCTVKPTHA